MEGLANGNVAVVHHDSQEETLHVAQAEEEVQLCHASHEGDLLCLCHKAQHCLGECDCHIPDLQEGQVTHKEIHGGVEVTVCSDSHNDGSIYC